MKINTLLKAQEFKLSKHQHLQPKGKGSWGIITSNPWYICNAAWLIEWYIDNKLQLSRDFFNNTVQYNLTLCGRELRFYPFIQVFVYNLISIWCTNDFIQMTFSQCNSICQILKIGDLVNCLFNIEDYKTWKILINCCSHNSVSS